MSLLRAALLGILGLVAIGCGHPPTDGPVGASGPAAPSMIDRPPFPELANQGDSFRNGGGDEPLRSNINKQQYLKSLMKKGDLDSLIEAERIFDTTEGDTLLGTVVDSLPKKVVGVDGDING